MSNTTGELSSTVDRNYWLTIFSPETWQEFLEAGGNTAGFQEIRASLVKKIQPGDYLLCYLTGVSKWIGILEVTSGYFIDDTPIWKGRAFPCRVQVKIINFLSIERAIPVLEMREQLTVFQNLANPKIWSGAFRVSPFLWKRIDGETVVTAIERAIQEIKTHSN